MALHNFFLRFAWPMVVIGGFLALACLTSTWYINRLQADMAKAIRHDAAGREAVQELQIQLRQLRFHSLMAVADPSSHRRKRVEDDRAQVEAALRVARLECDAEGDPQLLKVLENDYRDYEANLVADIPEWRNVLTKSDLLQWADAHQVQGLLVHCRDLVDWKRDQMNDRLQRSEAQTSWAGKILLGLGLFGAMGGLLSGYSTARGLNRRAARLSVRVQAVQSHLDQEVGAVLVEAPRKIGDLDEQLDQVVCRVKEVCERLQEKERGLLRAEQLAAVGHLAAGVAHEIRNPLTGMKFLVEAALRTANPTPLTTEDLQLVRKEIIRIERTIQGLLDFARMPPPHRRDHDLRNLVAEATAVTRGRAEAKPVALRVDAPTNPIPATIDHDQLLSLLTNLLFNAIDASPPGGEVDVRVCAASSGILQVEVSDTGSGIDPAVANRLFAPFVTTKPTGTGLGLTVAHRIARDHGGTLLAANRPQGGACFTLTLPIVEKAND